MAEARKLRTPDRVVRSLATAGGRTCARPGCPAPAQATLTFVYDERQARLGALLAERDPASYDLCTGHADRTSPPFGWTMSDQRPPESDAPAVDLADEDRTVAVISAALRAVPAATPARTPEPAPGPAPEPVVDAVVEVDDADVAVLTEALEQIADVETELVLAELHGLSELDPTDEDTTASDDAEVASATPTLPFDDPAPSEPAPSVTAELVERLERELASARPVDDEHDEELDDDWDEDAPLTPEGHAQAW